jgi:L-threonylcarbamoyladenylate synthase
VPRIRNADCSPAFHAEQNDLKSDGSSVASNLREAAALFRYLRELDQLDLDLIVAERLPEEGLGAAINDRLRRASIQL